MRTRSIILTIASIALLRAPVVARGDAEHVLPQDVRTQCVTVLRDALRAESPWVRVHAGEALAILGNPDPAIAAFRPQADKAGPEYRIGVWRVLALATGETRKGEYVTRIRRAFMDANGPDQTHAVEALAKLSAPSADQAEAGRVREIAEAAGPPSPFALWRLAQADDATAVPRLTALLGSADEPTRIRAAYVLGRLQPLPATAQAALAAAVERAPAGSMAHSVARAALGVDAAREMARDSAAPQYGKYSAAMRLAELGSPRDYPVLKQLSRDADVDVRVAAAFATLQIDARAQAAAGAGTRLARPATPAEK